MKQKSINNPNIGYRLERKVKNPYYVFEAESYCFLLKIALLRLTTILHLVSLSLIFGMMFLPNDLHNEGGVIFKKGKKPENCFNE